MLTNADITIYSYIDGKYIRTIISNVFWSDTKQSNILKSGLTTVDSVKILIPLSNITDVKFTTGKDLIVKGITEFEFDNTSQKTISESMKELQSKNRVVTLSIVDDKRYGSKAVQHLSLACR